MSYPKLNTLTYALARLPRSFMMEYDIHTLLDFMTLFATLWVIYTLRFPLKASYQAEQDSVYSYYVVRRSRPAGSAAPG